VAKSIVLGSGSLPCRQVSRVNNAITGKIKQQSVRGSGYFHNERIHVIAVHFAI